MSESRLCNKVKALRGIFEIGQFELSRRTNIPQSTLSMIEAGLIPGSLEQRGRLAEFFGLEVDEVFPEAGEK